MDKSKIMLVIFLVLMVIIRASDALTRTLMADEKLNSEKVSPSPAPNSPPVSKKLKPNQQPNPVGSPPDSSQPNDQPKDPSIPKTEYGTNRDEDKKENKDTQDGDKDEGIRKNKGPSNNEEKNRKNDDKKKESKDPSKIEDKNGEKDDKQKSVISPPKSPQVEKKDNGSVESDVQSKSQESTKKDDPQPESKEPNGEESHTEEPPLEKCEASLQKCQEQDLVACLQHSGIDSKEFVIVVHNAGDNTLYVTIAVPASIRIEAKVLNLTKHSTKKVNVSAADTKILAIVLSAGKGDCTLQIGMGPSSSDWIQQFPVYAKQLTPMYGAYFLFLTLVIGGGIWICCKFRNRGRRAGDGVPYQQIEMGTQRHSSTEIVEASTADGWEQGWDDDWDEEEVTVRPSTRSHNGNVSSNGLSSRSANKKNDWDIEWDD